MSNQLSRLKSENIVPQQEVVSSYIDQVHAYIAEDEAVLARIAMRKLLNASKQIDYESIGHIDSATYSHMDSLFERRNELADERQRLEAFIWRQDGVDIGSNPDILQRIAEAQKQIEHINTRLSPKVDAAIDAYTPNTYEVEAISELTGEAWPYYPELARAVSSATIEVTPETEEPVDPDQAKRAEVHNIIARLSYDKKGGLGLRYDVLTAYFFNKADTDSKNELAKTLAAMIRDDEVRVWTDGGIRYIEGLLAASPQKPEKGPKLIVVSLSIEDEITQHFVAEVLGRFKQQGYRRIQHGNTIEMQVPMAFVNEFAKSNDLIVSKDGPSSYHFTAT